MRRGTGIAAWTDSNGRLVGFVGFVGANGNRKGTLRLGLPCVIDLVLEYLGIFGVVAGVCRHMGMLEPFDTRRVGNGRDAPMGNGAYAPATHLNPYTPGYEYQ